MDKMTTLEILEEWSRADLDRLITKLNENGIASDEDELGLSSTMLENWTVSCDAFLTGNGYKGNSLKTSGKYIQNLGAVYILYDIDVFTYEEAQNYLLTFGDS
ncbi:hypothetical protein [Sessilibacter sp. MAH4]